MCIPCVLCQRNTNGAHRRSLGHCVIEPNARRERTTNGCRRTDRAGGGRRIKSRRRIFSCARAIVVTHTHTSNHTYDTIRARRSALLCGGRWLGFGSVVWSLLTAPAAKIYCDDLHTKHLHTSSTSINSSNSSSRNRCENVGVCVLFNCRFGACCTT